MLAAVQRSIPPACITVKVAKPLWKTLPTHYFIALEERMITEVTQVFMAERMKAKIVRSETDHTPSVTAPAVVVEVILNAITEL
ncbi:hypothetical protein [Legionella fallonii]|uniref:Uncharacterized protein n=1 Tax=Legionella fallonii LLAP-10 TaxID=1212491 RepID=A0A098G8K0_9GAMM|nr:hypothetical protein [Legionella fallonii]CEG58309.1 conserved protein of unknown function [Legionella fallonii LLAP-10]